MALIEDIVGLTPIETLGSLVHDGGVTAPVDGVMVLVISGLRLLVVKDTVEAKVDEVGSSISKGGVGIPNAGLSGSKYGKGGGDTLSLLGEGDEGG
ncbi:unnamed protein product [Adineta steineri]|uniref:Uncharacterized protein n=1 Tax=Adineta steineri TaxID=433720 RepID=A0A820QRJ5_9BILA|nr:unnamed protein product [Adineta steineri]